MSDVPQPLRIGRRDPSRIVIDWSDGSTSTFGAAELRRACPCALCVHELTGQALLDPTSVPHDLTQDDVKLVGTYGIAVRFSDGHHTGIYTYPYLREQGPARRAGS